MKQKNTCIDPAEFLALPLCDAETWNDSINYIPQIVMVVLVLALPKVLDTTQVTIINLVSTLKSDNTVVSFNCRMLSLDICICSISAAESVLLGSSILSTVKANSGGGSGLFPNEHSIIILGNTEPISSRQKSIPTV